MFQHALCGSVTYLLPLLLPLLLYSFLLLLLEGMIEAGASELAPVPKAMGWGPYRETFNQLRGRQQASALTVWLLASEASE